MSIRSLVLPTALVLAAGLAFTTPASAFDLFEDDMIELAQATPGDIDLLITDVVMPGLGGCELAARLAAQRPGLPVLFVSGYTGDEQDLEVGRNAQLLHKPFTAPALLAAAHGLLLARTR